MSTKTQPTVTCPNCGMVTTDFNEHMDKECSEWLKVSKLEKVLCIRRYLRDVDILDRVERENGEIRTWPDSQIEAVYKEVGAFEPRDNFLIAPRVDTYVSDVLKSASSR